jgi:hypothetical protein
MTYKNHSRACHPDRSAKLLVVPTQIYGAEWRDPEELSLATLIQGVLSMECPSYGCPRHDQEQTFNLEPQRVAPINNERTP